MKKQNLFSALYMLLVLVGAIATAQPKLVHRGYLGWVRELSTTETKNLT